jgi:suppressor of G2 allele of SKP1
VNNALTDTEAALALLDGTFNPSQLLLTGEIDACKRRKTDALSLKIGTHQDPSSNDDSTSKSNSRNKEDPSFSKPSSIKKEPSCPKYQYYQNDNFMTIAILESNVKQEQMQVEFETKHLSVIVEKEGQKFTVIYSPLYDEINVEKSKVKFMDEKVLIKLNKKEKHEWHDLFGRGESKKSSEKDSMAKPIPTTKKTTTRPYASHRDWDAIERDVAREEESESPEGDEAVNKLFQSIYKNANEDTRRAMIKSFQTSGGTCLSTNWEEVEKTDYEKKTSCSQGSRVENMGGR